MVKFNNDGGDKLQFTFDDAVFSDGAPCTNSGFAGSKSSLKPEYKYKEGISHSYKDGDTFEVVNGASGQLEVSYRYDGINKNFKRQ